MKDKAGLERRGNGMRNESRILKRRQRRRSKMVAACIPLLLFCFNRSWLHSARPGWHWGNKESPPCTMTHPLETQNERCAAKFCLINSVFSPLCSHPIVYYGTAVQAFFSVPFVIFIFYDKISFFGWKGLNMNLEPAAIEHSTRTWDTEMLLCKWIRYISWVTSIQKLKCKNNKW